LPKLPELPDIPSIDMPGFPDLDIRIADHLPNIDPNLLTHIGMIGFNFKQLKERKKIHDKWHKHEKVNRTGVRRIRVAELAERRKKGNNDYK